MSVMQWAALFIRFTTTIDLNTGCVIIGQWQDTSFKSLFKKKKF